MQDEPETQSEIDAVKAGILEKITGSLKKKEGFRHLWLGDSGMGKTYANRVLLNHLRRRREIDVFLTVDEKSRWESQFPGKQTTFRANPAHLKHQPPGRNENPADIVFRGVSLRGNWDEQVSYEEVALMAMELVSQQPIMVCVNIDELADATNGYQAWEGEKLPQLYRKGRGMGISVIAANQLPQNLPREAFGLSDTIVVFRVSGREAVYLKTKNVIEDEDVEQIQSLQVGEFRFFQKSAPRDTNIYKFSKGVEGEKRK